MSSNSIANKTAIPDLNGNSRDLQSGMFIAAPNKMYADVWSRDKLDSTRMKAYKNLERADSIRIQKIVYSKSDQKVVIQYLCNAPQQWIHDLLKAEVQKEMESKMVQTELNV